MNQTKIIKVKPIPWGSYSKFHVDVEIADLVAAFNKVGLITTSSCSGHVGDYLSTAISFHTTGNEALEKLKKLVSSNKLSMNWELEGHFNHYNLYIKEGLYGSKKIIGSKENMAKVKRDLEKIKRNIKGGKIK